MVGLVRPFVEQTPRDIFHFRDVMLATLGTKIQMNKSERLRQARHHSSSASVGAPLAHNITSVLVSSVFYSKPSDPFVPEYFDCCMSRTFQSIFQSVHR